MLLSKRNLLAVAAVIDVALHAPSGSVAAKALADRHNLPPRHLETLLQFLVKASILKGVRGPRGGYELAKERRRISVADIIRATLSSDLDKDGSLDPNCLIESIIQPRLQTIENRFLEELEQVSIEEMCNETHKKKMFEPTRGKTADFTI